MASEVCLGRLSLPLGSFRRGPGRIDDGLNLLRFSLAGVKVVFTLESDAGSRRCCIRVVGVPFLVQRSVICYTSCDPCTWYWYPGQAGVLFGVTISSPPPNSGVYPPTHLN